MLPEHRVPLSPVSCGPAVPESPGYPLWLPVGVWQSCGDKHHHTAHELHFHRIHYRYHPNYGQSVDIIRCLRRQQGETLIVNFDDDFRLAVPDWMLDAAVCGDLREAEEPEIAINALLALRTLLDAQSLPERRHSGSCGSLPITSGDYNEPPKEYPSPQAGKVAAGQRCTVGATTSGRTRSLSRTRRTVADGPGAKPDQWRQR